MIQRKIFKLTILALSILNLQAHAKEVDYLKAHAPYRIKPNTPSLAPTGLTPATIRSYYGFDQITNQGEGQVIAIVDAYDNPNIESDLALFNSTYNLPACTTGNGCFAKVYAAGTQPAGNTAWGVEIALDVEWAHAIAPKAKIVLVETQNNTLSNLYAGVTTALTFSPAVVSMSWGSYEYPSEINNDPLFNVTGTAFVAASMDNGNGVWYPAASPYVIGVGGTTLSPSGSNFNETAWPESSGGLSAYEAQPSFQSTFPIPNNSTNKRGVPDISYVADPNTGLSVYDTYGFGGWMVVGGTSAGAPQWAGLIAIAKSANATSVNGLLGKLYSIAKSNYSSNYNDIITGSNGPCGTLCNAAAGYDYVTGLGSPKANNLIPSLVGQTGITVSVTPPSVSLQVGKTQQFTASVSGSSNTSVTWSATGGTITNSGFYTAPMTTGQYVVKATSVADPSKSGTADVQVISTLPSNLALNRPTIASSEQSAPAHPATDATDSNTTTTRWTAIDGGTGQWLMVDLGAKAALTGSQVKWEFNSPYKYKIEISPDEVQWTTVIDKTNNTTAAQTFNDSFNGTGRYIKITSTGLSSGQWAAIYDFQALGTYIEPFPTNPPTNLALNKATTASSIESASYAPAMATDSDTMHTRWSPSSGATPQWLMVDLGAKSNISKARVKWESYGPWQYKIETSLDGTSWTVALDKTTNTVSSQTYEDVFTASARYVRVTATKNPSGKWSSILDFQVFGNITP